MSRSTGEPTDSVICWEVKGDLQDRVKPNVLAPYLTPLYEMFFRAEDPEKIQLILDQAYVDTAELREYDQVLHVMLPFDDHAVARRIAGVLGENEPPSRFEFPAKARSSRDDRGVPH
jgi:hypothetical protein